MPSEIVKIMSLPPPSATLKATRPEGPERSAPGNKADKAGAGTALTPATVRADEQKKPAEERDDKGLAQAVHDLHEYVQTSKRNLEFDIDEASGRTVIRVSDAESGKLIRQIPAEEVLEITRRLRQQGDTSEGVFLRERV